MILSDRLQVSGYMTDEATSIAEASKKLLKKNYQIVLLDIFLPDQDKLEGLEAIKKAHPSTPVIVMTAHGTIDLAVEAMKHGAYEFVTKPIDFKRLGILIDRAIESLELRSEISYLRKTADEPYSEIIGVEKGLKEVMDLVRDVARSDTTVMLRGETGTGKEVIARAIHRLSKRADRTLVVANCAAIPRELMESEMFGHVKGAFTSSIQNHIGYFESAGNGTLFLDEIGDLDLDLQAKILRVLENGSFKKVGSQTDLYSRARIITSTHQPLERLIEENKFREDLFYRINVFPIKIPPLRDRREDIPDLIDYFINLYEKKSGGKKKMIDEEAKEALVNYGWPGNVRELKNSIERLMLTRQGDSITTDDISSLLNRENGGKADTTIRELREVEKEEILKALSFFDGNRTKTAKALGIGRRTLQNKLKIYGEN